MFNIFNFLLNRFIIRGVLAFLFVVISSILNAVAFIKKHLKQKMNDFHLKNNQIKTFDIKQKEYEIRFTTEQLNKKGSSFYNNGNKEYEGNYKEALWKAYHKNGNIKEEGQFINDIKNGNWVYYYYNGNKECEGNYKEGEKNGVWMYWYKSGKKEKEELYLKGKRHGLSTLYYKNGNKKSEGNYEEGKKEGLWKVYYENGNIKEEGYVSGELKTIEKKYRTFYEDFPRTYIEEPWIESFITIKERREGYWKEWYKNGEIKQEGNYKNGYPIGYWCYWHENGQKKAEGVYEKNKKDKIHWINEDEVLLKTKGQLTTQHFDVCIKANKTWKYWDFMGQVVSENEVKLFD